MDFDVIEKRSTRSKKIQRAIDNFKESLSKENISQDEYDEKISKYIEQTKLKYRRTRGKKQRMEEFKCYLFDKFRKENPNLLNEEILQLMDPLVEKRNKELSQTTKSNKKNKTRAQKLDGRKIEFVKQLRNEYPEITDEEIQQRLEEYKKVESTILEDDITFNKKMMKIREELEEKYPTDPQSLSKIKDILVKRMTREQGNFLGVSYKFTESLMDARKTNNEVDQAEREKKRILNMKDNDKIRELIKTIDNVNEIFPINQDASDNQTKNQILETESDEILLQKYKDEMEEKYSNNTKLLLRERYNMINSELKQRSAEVKRKIQLSRKLSNEKEQTESDWSKLKKYKNNKELLIKDLHRHMEQRRKILEEYEHMGIDPEEHDNASVKIAEKIWLDIHNTVNKNVDKWNKMTEKQKIDPFIEKYSDFSTSYPLILKYMIFELQYNSNALRKFLKICRKNLPKQSAKQHEIQDVRFQNQAKYVQFLYEELQKENNQHINKKISQKIFNDTLTSLRKEKKEFEKKYEETRKKIDAEKIDQGRMILSELITQIKSGYTLNETEEEEAISLLNYVIKVQEEQQNSIDNTVKDSIKGYTKITNIA